MGGFGSNYYVDWCHCNRYIGGDSMDIDVKKLAKQQYFKYFKIWFIVVGVLAVIGLFVFIASKLEKSTVRNNSAAPAERVYDNADVLTDAEEDKLRALIAEAEEKIHSDIVLVTMNQAVEGSDAQAQYNYRYDDWELNMRDLADDFYDNNNYGYESVGGSGVLLLDNWYEGQAGSWLSTCGDVYIRFGDYEINRVLDEVYYTIDDGAYKAYAAYVDEVVDLMQTDGESLDMSTFVMGALFVPTIVAGIYVAANMSSKDGKVTTNTTTYVANGKPRMNVSSDNFLRKHVSTRVIQTSSSSGGGSRSSSGGRGGSHRSSSGRSHGGGGRRR